MATTDLFLVASRKHCHYNYRSSSLIDARANIISNPSPGLSLVAVVAVRFQEVGLQILKNASFWPSSAGMCERQCCGGGGGGGGRGGGGDADTRSSLRRQKQQPCLHQQQQAVSRCEKTVISALNQSLLAVVLRRRHAHCVLLYIGCT